MLEFRTRISNSESARHYDENGFMTVDSPILNEDVLEYMGYELLGGKGVDDVQPRDIAGITVYPDKVYTVRIPHEELEKSAPTFQLLPLVDGHKWLNGGNGDADAKEYQEGSTGENARVEDGKLFVPLKFTGKGILSHLKEGVEELSASYEHNLEVDNTGKADFIAVDIVGNHVALVERGRCGSEVRVYNSSNNGVEMKSNNEIALLIDGKKVDLAQFFEQEAEEQEHEGTDAIVPAENDDVDKRKIIDDIGGMLKDKGLDDEDIRTVIGMAEKLAYEDSSAGTADNKCSNEDEVEEVEEEKEEDKIAVENAKVDALRAEIAKSNAEAHKAYNEAVALTGEDFNAVGLNASQIYAHALKERGIKAENKSLAEMKAMVETLKSVRVDNSFAPAISSVADDEIEINC